MAFLVRCFSGALMGAGNPLPPKCVTNVAFFKRLSLGAATKLHARVEEKADHLT